mgnify:CR=1 FL=1
MIYKELNQRDNAPQKGVILAYTRQEIIFQEYSDIADVEKILADKELVEIHLFDEKKEYRALVTTGNRVFNNSAKGTVEHIADFKSEDIKEYGVYKDNILLDESFNVDHKSIAVLNKISYDDNGMANIDDYRLVIK